MTRKDENTPEDRRIITLFLQRSEEAVRAVEQKYKKLCFTIAHNVLANREDSEQCVNDTFLKAWDNIPPDEPDMLSAYLARMTRNLALDRYRSSNAAKRRCTKPDVLISELNEDVASGNKTEELFDAHYISEIINRWLRSVSDDKAMVFTMRYYFWYTEDEISVQTGFSYNKVATMLCRMRKELKKVLEKEGVEI